MPKKTPKERRGPTDQLLIALGHPLRRRILESLMRKPASASGLSAQFGMKDKLGVVSYHLIEWEKLPWLVAVGLREVALGSFVKAAVAAIEAEAGDGEPVGPNGGGLYEFRPVGVDADGHREIAKAAEKLKETVSVVADRCSGFEPTELTQLIVGTAVFEAASSSPQEAT